VKVQTDITRHTILEIVITLYLARLLFPLLFLQLPFPFHSYYFYGALVFAAFAILYPKSYFLKSLVPFYVFFAIHIIFTPLIWGKSIIFLDKGQYLNIKSVIIAYFPLFIALLVYNHYINKNDFITLGRICKRAIIFTFLGVINSLIVLINFPQAIREANLYLGTFYLSEYYKYLGLLDYGFFNALCSIFPILVYMVIKSQIDSYKKIGWIIFILLSFTSIIYAQITAFLLFSAIFGITAIFLRENYKKDIIYFVIALLIVVLVIPSSSIAQIFYRSSEFFPYSVLGDRLFEAGLTIENPYIDYYASPYHAGRRLGRIPLLLESFLSNPIIGGGLDTNHAKWFDMLSAFGLLGFVPWVWLIVDNYKRNLKILNKKYIPYYMLSIIAFIAMGCIKNTGYDHTWIFWFLIAPGANFIYINNYNDISNNNYIMRVNNNV